MSQEKLGELLGLTFQQVQKYEKGANRIGASRLYDISSILGVPVSYFFDDLVGDHGVKRNTSHAASTDIDAGPYMMEFVSSAEGFQLVRAFTKITDPRVRKRMLDLVKSLTGEEEVYPDFRVVELREAQRA